MSAMIHRERLYHGYAIGKVRCVSRPASCRPVGRGTFFSGKSYSAYLLIVETSIIPSENFEEFMPKWLRWYIFIAIVLHLMSGYNRPPEYLLLNIPASLIIFGIPALVIWGITYSFKR